VTLQPSEQNLALIERRHRSLRRLTQAVVWPVVGVDVEGSEHVPKGGPLVLVANHTNLLDPVTISIAAVRPLIWVGTRTLLTGPLARVVAGFGMIPKQRFATDAPAVRTMRRWLDLGAAVAVFPEGERSWSGQLQPLVPGVERLVRMLGVPVVRAACHNTYLQWPRWSSRPRRGRVAVRFTAAGSFERRADLDEISRWVTDGIRVDVRSRPDLVLSGRGLAAGLSNVVFLCPACGQEEHIVERGDTLHCTACAGVWRVDVGARLHREGHDPVLLDTWMTATRRTCLARLPESGELLASAPVEVVEHSGEPQPVARGRLVLYADRIAVESDGRTPFVLSLPDIVNVNIEYQRVLEVRTADRFFTATIAQGSAWRWPWTMQAARSRLSSADDDP
jgi:1-acyl-sn-glycerol-3-phosphate acyltransferase